MWVEDGYQTVYVSRGNGGCVSGRGGRGLPGKVKEC